MGPATMRQAKEQFLASPARLLSGSFSVGRAVVSLWRLRPPFQASSTRSPIRMFDWCPPRAIDSTQGTSECSPLDGFQALRRAKRRNPGYPLMVEGGLGLAVALSFVLSSAALAALEAGLSTS